MAGCMGLELPPMPPSSAAELRMVKDFCEHHPQLSARNISNLCSTFLSRSNGRDIYPKLPPMIKPAIKR
eukprot:scaffold57717_cov39-Attheya_sp.AAC.1